jgi:hypothetical protein
MYVFSPSFRGRTDLHENDVILNRKIRGKVVGIRFSQLQNESPTTLISFSQTSNIFATFLLIVATFSW